MTFTSRRSLTARGRRGQGPRASCAGAARALREREALIAEMSATSRSADRRAPEPVRCAPAERRDSDPRTSAPSGGGRDAGSTDGSALPRRRSSRSVRRAHCAAADATVSAAEILAKSATQLSAATTGVETARVRARARRRPEGNDGGPGQRALPRAPGHRPRRARPVPVRHVRSRRPDDQLDRAGPEAAAARHGIPGRRTAVSLRRDAADKTTPACRFQRWNGSTCRRRSR